MSAPAQSPPAGEDGFALIEVLVSALILAIVAGRRHGPAAGDHPLRRPERRHAEAYAVAQEDQARLRSLRLSYLNRLEQTRTVTIDGNEFTVESQGVFVNNTSGQPRPAHRANLSRLRADHLDRRPGPAPSSPVVIQSIVSPSNGSLDPNHGTLVVTTNNAAAEPLSGVGALGHRHRHLQRHHRLHRLRQLRRPPVRQLQRRSQRARPGRQTRRTAAAQPTSVIAGGTNTLPLEFDYGATLPVKFKYRVGSGSEFKAANDRLGLRLQRHDEPGESVLGPRQSPGIRNPRHAGLPLHQPGHASTRVPAKQPTRAVGRALGKRDPPARQNPGTGAETAGSGAGTDGDQQRLRLSSGARSRSPTKTAKSTAKTSMREYTTDSNGHQIKQAALDRYGCPGARYEHLRLRLLLGRIHRRRESGVTVQDPHRPRTRL